MNETLLTLRWNIKYNCLEVMRVLYVKGNISDLTLDKTQKRVQDAEMRAEPGIEKDLPGTAIKIQLNKTKEEKNESILNTE